MAPLDPDSTARSNILPVSLFAGQILLVVGLTANVLLTARRAAKSLPPATATRAQEPFRREQTILFSCIAFASLFFVTFFAFAWRALSYLQWAHSHGHEAPNTLWSGREGVGNWRLGDWLSDVNLVTESDAATVAKPEAFLYTTEHFVGLLAASIFMGVEGRRRNLSNSTVASFVLLSTTGSLGYALSLFFVTMLYTPLSIHSARTRRHDTLFTPKPAVLYIPVILSIFGIYKLPSMLKLSEDVLFVRSSYVLVPLFLAFAPQVRLEHLFCTLNSDHGLDHPRQLGTTPHLKAIRSSLIHHRILGTISGLFCPALEHAYIRRARQYTYRAFGYLRVLREIRKQE
jgi:hypothetical protein